MKKPAETTLVIDWPAPDNVGCIQTTRHGGVSEGAFKSWNFSTKAGDEAAKVRQNRQLLAETIGCDVEKVCCLNQVHGVDVLDLPISGEARDADASFTKSVGEVCLTMTADCLPVLLCDRQGNSVAAVHCGWRSLAMGILGRTLAKFADPGQVIAWLGPAIGPEQFEVGEEVRQTFDELYSRDKALAKYSEQERQTLFEAAFITTSFEEQTYLANLYLLAEHQLAAYNVHSISGGGHCTFSEEDRFFSYRRDGVTGRMATAIWLNPIA